MNTRIPNVSSVYNARVIDIENAFFFLCVGFFFQKRDGEFFISGIEFRCIE